MHTVGCTLFSNTTDLHLRRPMYDASCVCSMMVPDGGSLLYAHSICTAVLWRVISLASCVALLTGEA